MTSLAEVIVLIVISEHIDPQMFGIFACKIVKTIKIMPIYLMWTTN